MSAKRRVKKTHYRNEKDELLLRLRKIEGQVRGTQQMIVEDRYCLDVLQQINALTAAAREVAATVLEIHLKSCIEEAAQDRDGAAAVQEMLTVVRKTVRSL